MVTDAHCAMSASEFKDVLRNLEPEIIIWPKQAWRLLSFDEIAIKMDTHDEGTGSSRNCEQTIRDNSPGGRRQALRRLVF